jgi:formate--tetrahydrofolate ligase
MAIQLGDYAITEAGFGFDLGGEKFLNIKCRQAGIWPRLVVIVATLRALKMHGGAPVKSAGDANAERLEAGLPHLEKHIENAHAFGLAPVIAINVFPNDSRAELEMVEKAAAKLGARVALSEGFSRGGEGTLELARLVAELADGTDAAPPKPRFIYELGDSAPEKIRKIARTIYGASDAVLSHAAEKELERIATLGYEKLPICMAKTQLSLTDHPAIFGRPRDFAITVREIRLSAGAGFLVPLTGEMMTMPGLPKVPAARHVKLLPDGTIKGLMQNE